MGQHEVLNIIEKRKEVTIYDLKLALDMHERGIKRSLSVLMKKGMIERELIRESPKVLRAYYHVPNKKNEVLNNAIERLAAIIRH